MPVEKHNNILAVHINLGTYCITEHVDSYLLRYSFDIYVFAIKNNTLGLRVRHIRLDE